MASVSENVSGDLKEAGGVEYLASVINNGSLVLTSLKKQSLRSVLIFLAGHGASQVEKKNPIQQVQEAVGLGQAIKVEKTLTINKPADELYRFWHNFENLPNFMKHLKEVKVLDSRRSHWVATAPLGTSVEWNAEILQDRENEFISWASIEGADVGNSGFVRFKQAPGDRGTEVKIVMEYTPPGGALAAVFAKLFGEEPEQQIGDDLRRFKMLMEAGEIATTEGQPRGK